MGCVCSKASRGPPPPHVLYCRLPEGVHSHMLEHVDMKKVTKLVKSGRLAPLYPHDVKEEDVMEECPICTVSYPSMNTASCCSARVCTECFVYHQTSSDPPGRAQCPFCKCSPFAVRYLGSRPKELLQKEQQEQLSVKQARQRLKLQQDTPAPHADINSSATAGAAAAGSVQQDTPSQQTPPAPQQPSTTQGGDNHQLHLQERRQQQQQHNWLDELSSPHGGSSSSRRIENISVFAGYHHRSSSSSGGASTAADTGTQQDTTSSTGRTPHTILTAAVPAVPTGSLGLHHQQQQHDMPHDMQQQQQDVQREQLYAAAQLLELQLQQLTELRNLHEAGLLPGYAAAELSGLRLEELDEILLEQAIMESLTPRTAAAQA